LSYNVDATSDITLPIILAHVICEAKKTQTSIDKGATMITGTQIMIHMVGLQAKEVDRTLSPKDTSLH
jgi:hypothetical protein